MGKIIKSLYKKEMLDILRDKKTILVMILIPLVVYPLLFFGTMMIATQVLSNQETATYRIAFEQIDAKEEIQSVMAEEEEKMGYLFEMVEVKDAGQALQQGKIDAYLTQSEKNGQIAYEIQYLSTGSASSTAADHMMTVLEDYREQLRMDAVEQAGMDITTVLYPITATQTDHASNEENFGQLLGAILPFLLVVSILMGAIYPAIDATAGEKERGTLETLLTLPVSNMQLIFSKFLAVSTVASVSALLNFISVGIFGTYMYQTMGIGGARKFSIDLAGFVPALLVMLLCILAFAMFMSALCLCICIFAKSFKEAQNYVSPLMIVVMLVSYIGFLPDLSLDSTYAVVPIANIVLLVKNIFSFHYTFGNLFLVLLTNVVYSFLSVILMSRLYDTESMLFGEGGSLKLFERRANMKKGQMPGMGDAVLVMAIAILLIFYVQGIAVAKLGLAGVGVQQLCFLVLVFGFAWYIKADQKKLFSLGRPKGRHILGALLLWAGTYLFAILLSTPLARLFPSSASQMEQMTVWLESQPLWMLVLVVAVAPAICEEMLFRGFLFGTMKEKWKPWIAILVSGILFGVYHMSLVKTVTVSLLGIVFAYVVYVSDSILCSVLMHLCNNGLAVLHMANPIALKRVLPFLFAEKLSVTLVVEMSIAGFFLCLGGWLLVREWGISTKLAKK